MSKFKSIRLDGSTGCISSPLTIHGDWEKPLTVSLWCKAETVTRPLQSLVDAYGGPGEFANFRLYLAGDKVVVHHNGETHSGAGRIYPNQWHHISYVYHPTGWASSLSTYDSRLVGAYEYEEPSGPITNMVSGPDLVPNGPPGHRQMGKLGYGYRLTSPAYLDLGNNLPYLPEISFFTWFFRETPGNNIHLFNLGKTTSDGDPYLAFYLDSSGNTILYLRGASTWSVTSGFSWPQGRWTHLGFTIKNNQGIIWMDGIKINEGALNDTPGSAVGPHANIGRHRSGSAYVTGWIDNTFLWSAGLSEEDVGVLYNNGMGRSLLWGQGKLYIDGQLVDTIMVPRGKPKEVGVTIGGSVDRNPNAFFKGNIEELYVWDRALSEGDLSLLSQRLYPRVYSLPDSYNNWVEKVGAYDDYLVGAWVFDDYDRKFDAYYTFVTPDLSGNFHSNLGYFLSFNSNTEGLVSRWGRSGGSLYVTGSGRGSTSGPDLANTSFVVSLWFLSRVYSSDSRQTLFVYSNNPDGTNQGIGFYLYRNYLIYQVGSSSIGTTGWGSKSIQQHQWYHAVFTYEWLGGTSGRGRVYLNGELDWSGNFSQTNQTVDGPCHFGRRSDGAWGFPGYLDQIYIWRTLPTDIDGFVRSLYNKGAGLKPPRQRFSDRNPLITTNRKYLWPPLLRASDSSLVSHWKMDSVEGTNLVWDDAGLRHGTLYGNVRPTQYRRSTRARLCYYFGGSPTADYVLVPSSPDFNVSAMTLSLWISAESWTNSANIRLVDRMDTVGTGDGFYIERTGSNGPIVFGLRLGSNTYTLGSTTILNTVNNWYHIVVTWSGTRMEMWIDGVKQGNFTTTPQLTMSSTRPINFGRSASGGGTSPFLGRMASVHLWKVSLSEAQILALYSGGVGPDYTPVYTQWPRELSSSNYNLVSLWPLDEGTGMVRDRWGKNHGTPSGSILYGGTGLVGKCITLTSTSQSLDFGSHPSLDLESGLTLSVWVRKGSPWGTSGNEYDVVGKGSREENGYGISIQETPSGPEVNFWIKNAGALLRVKKLQPPSWGTTSWVHLAGTFQSGSAFLFLDGYPVASGNIEELGSTSLSLRLGRGHSSGSLALPSSIEELAIWNQPLSSTQINLLWNSGQGRVFPQKRPLGWTGRLAAADSDLRYYWKLNEREGETIRDHIGYWTTTASTEGSPSFRSPGVDGDYGIRLGRTTTSLTSNDAINLGIGPNEWQGFTGLTLSLWNRLAENDRRQVLFYHGYSGGFIIYSGLYPGFDVILSDGNSYGVYATQAPKGEWIHLVGTWQRGRNLAFYMNGELIGSLHVPDLPLYNYSTSYPTTIGRNFASGSNYSYAFGDIDEIMVWKAPLSPLQVKDLYNQGSGRIYYNSSARLRDYEPHLISGWKFEETTGPRFDSIGENTLLETNGSISRTTGKGGGGANLVGTSGFMATSPVGFPSGDQCYTVSCHIRINTLPADWVDIWALDTVDSTSYIALRLTSTGHLRHTMYHGSEVFQGSTTPLSTGVWYHVVATYDGTRFRLYIDNVEQGSGAVGTPGYQPHRWVVGQSYGGASPVRYFNGVIDELYLWDTYLSPTSIDELYRGGHGWFVSEVGFTEGLAYQHRDMVSAWKFEDQGRVLDSLGDGLGSPYGGIIYRVPGKDGYGIKLNGSDGHIELEPEIFDNFSISCWICTSDVDYGGGKGWFHGKGILDGKREREARDFGLTLSEGKLAFGTGTSSPVAPSVNTLRSRSLINTGEWVHLVVTRDRRHGDKKIYINGLLESETSASISSLDEVQKLVIGAVGDKRPGSFLNFYIDELYFWGYPLSPNLVRSLYNNGRGRFYLKGSNSWTGLVTASNSSLRLVYRLSDTSSPLVESVGTPGVTATYNGALYSQPGRYGMALGFDGLDDQIQILDSLDPTQYTWSFWVKPLAWSTQILRRSDNGTGVSQNLYITSSGRFAHTVFDGSTRTITGTTVVKLGRWYHVVVSYAQNLNMRLYVDGVEEASGTTGSPLWTGGDRYFIGNGSTGNGGYFLGTIDEAYYWTSQLSPLTVMDLFNMGTGKFYGA